MSALLAEVLGYFSEAGLCDQWICRLLYILVLVNDYVLCRFENGMAGDGCWNAGCRARHARAEFSQDPGGVKLAGLSATARRR